MTITATHIDLLRHGEVEGGSCYRGITDDPLSATGWKQMHNKLSGAPAHWDIIISSPLSRCHAFAKALADKRQLTFISTSAFQEINFGDWEGKTAAQINITDNQLLTLFYSNPVDYPPPNSEPFMQFQQRVLQAWIELHETHHGKRILLITHAGVIRVILANILGCDIEHSFRLKIAHTCLSNIICFQETNAKTFFQLVSHG